MSRTSDFSLKRVHSSLANLIRAVRIFGLGCQQLLLLLFLQQILSVRVAGSPFSNDYSVQLHVTESYISEIYISNVYVYLTPPASAPPVPVRFY